MGHRCRSYRRRGVYRRRIIREKRDAGAGKGKGKGKGKERERGDGRVPPGVLGVLWRVGGEIVVWGPPGHFHTRDDRI